MAKYIGSSRQKIINLGIRVFELKGAEGLEQLIISVEGVVNGQIDSIKDPEAQRILRGQISGVKYLKDEFLVKAQN